MRIEYKFNTFGCKSPCGICREGFDSDTWQPVAYEDDGKQIDFVCLDCVKAAEAEGAEGLASRIREAADWYREQAGKMDERAVVMAGETVLVFNDTAKADVLALLLRLKAQTQDTGGPFVGMGGAFARRWAKIVAKAGIEPIRFHALRATFATRLIRTGVPLPTVQRLCGHAAIQTTLDYYNWTSDQDLRDGIDELDRAAG